MIAYELYINDILCDLSSEEDITLLYQSPIFSELDNIQSNRSYNISLPITATNTKAVGFATRPDIDSDIPYIKNKAVLYQNGTPIFENGFAVVTDISDTINVTLTWGNVDNFQPLFDNDLNALSEQLEEMGYGHIDWNDSTEILEANTTNEYPGVAFWGVNFGMGLSNPKFIHPSAQVSTIISAIENFNGITIDGKERLEYSKNLGPIIPLVSKNGDNVSNFVESLMFQPNFTNYRDTIYRVIGRETIIQDPHHIAYGYCTTKFDNIDSKVNIKILPNEGLNEYVIIARMPKPLDDVTSMYLMLSEVNNVSTEGSPTVLAEANKIEYIGIEKNEYGESKVYKCYFDSLDINYKLKNTTEILLHYETNPLQYKNEWYPLVYSENTITVTIWSDWKNIIFPTIFPVAPNLPNISQGDFILSLMSINGLFAYVDNNNPNTIKLISIDDILENAKSGDVLDWSDKVIINEFNRVDMPDASTFAIDGLAQNNILDYDNDDDVENDTYGVITVNNANIEKETELVDLPFSASENVQTGNINCALVPIYKDNGNNNVSYLKKSPRILSGRGAFIDGIARCIGVFDQWMSFGGSEGIVNTRYLSYQSIVNRVHIITINAKLSALDLYNLDYTKPIYIGQFGQVFAIYSVETGEDGICTCQMIKLNTKEINPYYLSLVGGTPDITDILTSASSANKLYNVLTNGTLEIKSKDNRLTTLILKSTNGYIISVNIPANETGNIINYDPIVLGIEEKNDLVRNIYIQQES